MSIGKVETCCTGLWFQRLLHHVLMTLESLESKWQQEMLRPFSWWQHLVQLDGWWETCLKWSTQVEQSNYLTLSHFVLQNSSIYTENGSMSLQRRSQRNGKTLKSMPWWLLSFLPVLSEQNTAKTWAVWQNMLQSGTLQTFPRETSQSPKFKRTSRTSPTRTMTSGPTSSNRHAKILRAFLLAFRLSAMHIKMKSA